ATLGVGHPYPGLAATHDDKGSGKYAEKAAIAPTEGKWALVVTLKGKAPVVQPLKLKQGKGGEFTASPQPSAVATVTITGAVRTVGASKVKEISFHVTLFPAAEIVFIAGVDYNRVDIGGGWQFHEYGFNRAEALRREKKIHAGAIVTVFSTSKIRRTTRVWGVKKWVDIEVAQIGDPSTRVFGTEPDSYKPVAGLDIHITDFYKYLAEVGTREPKSVREIGIFSHAWPGGPILYNTGERAAFKAITTARDPHDFDARPKDFNAHNFPGYDKMPDAFATGCRFTIWGCSATTHFKFACRRSLEAINRGLAEDAFLIVRSELEDNHDPAVGVFAIEEEHTSELRHRFLMDSLFRRSTYAAEAARKLGIEVRAGCPGTGSDNVDIEGVKMLMVDLALYHDVFGYFHKKFSPEFAETKGKWDQGYVDYHALQSRAIVAKPSFSTEYYDLNIQTKVTRWQPATGAQLTFWNRKTVFHPTPNVQVVMKPVADLVTVGKKGHLFVLKDKDKTKSQAVFVQEDEKVFMITQDAKHEWTVKGAEI
ncbi:MAG: hypothetical protein ACR2I2_14420, partial [Bryobacteraceae bacterium]